MDQLPNKVKMIEQNIPTPNARDWKDSTQKSSMNALEAGSQMTLGRYVHKYPTPIRSDYQHRRKSENWDGSDLVSTVTEIEEENGNEQPKAGGALNPTWVEWLMGWPIGWTSMEPITDLDWRDWKTDPADEGEPGTWATPKASIDGTSPKTLQMVRDGDAEKSLMRQVLMEGTNTGSIPRVATGIKHRVGRLKAIGNGQVPQVAALAWRILTDDI